MYNRGAARQKDGQTSLRLPGSRRALPLLACTVHYAHAAPAGLDPSHVPLSAGTLGLSAELAGLIGELAETLLGYSQVREQNVFDPGHVGFPLRQGPGSCSERAASLRILRCVRVRCQWWRERGILGLLPVQPS
uniref:Uncharacterized protein n=1 Tax=Cacopsylla melanoneura TaxID=428564 RepID=A0A8D8PVY3_9HEMI